MLRWRWAARLACALLWLPAFAHAEVSDPCASPRSAAANFLDNLQPEQLRPADAVRCFERPAGVDEATLQARAADLKSLLDARGLWVPVDDLPAAADFANARGRHQVALVEGLPEVYLVRQKEAWRFPAAVVERIPALRAATFSSWGESVVAELPDWLRATVLGYAVWQLAGLALVVVLGLLLGALLRFLVESRLGGLLRRWRVETPALLLGQVARPLGRLAAVGFMALFLAQLRLPLTTSRVLFLAVTLVAALSGVMVAYRVVDVFSLWLEQKAATTASKLDDQLAILARKTLHVAVIAVGIVFVLQNLSIDVGGLVAGLGLGGLAFALAAKDTAANLFGSITIFVDQPFHVGDYIVAAGTEGTVLEIGLRSTRLRTGTDSVITVANSVLATVNIDNLSRRTRRRFRTNLAVTYDTPPERLEAFVVAVRTMLAERPDVRPGETEVHLNDNGEAALLILVQLYLNATTWSDELAARHQILLGLLRLADQHGVALAWPARMLQLPVPNPRSP